MSTPPPPQGQGYASPPGYAAPPPQKKSHTGAIIGVVVVVILVVVLAGLWAAGVFSTSSSPGGGGGGATVDITAINLEPTSETSTCWTSSTGTGGSVAAGQSFSTSWTLSYTKSLFGPASCTVQSVSMQTAGFSIVSSNTPLVVDSGGTQTLTIVIGTPSTSYTGTVTIDESVTAP
jgi:hypothetical protein